jgi:hypothetical protein
MEISCQTTLDDVGSFEPQGRTKLKVQPSVLSTIFRKAKSRAGKSEGLPLALNKI